MILSKICDKIIFEHKSATTILATAATRTLSTAATTTLAASTTYRNKWKKKRKEPVIKGLQSYDSLSGAFFLLPRKLLQSI